MDGKAIVTDLVFTTMALIRRILASRIFRLGFVALTLAFGVWYIAEKWGGIHEGLNRIGLLAALGAVACVLAALVCTMLVWRVLLAGLGSPLSVSTASRVLFRRPARQVPAGRGLAGPGPDRAGRRA